MIRMIRRLLASGWRRSAAVAAVFATFMIGCDATSRPKVRETGGNYPPVTEHMLIGAEFSDRTGGTAFSEMIWKFTHSRFVIEAGSDGLPEDLTGVLAPNVDATPTQRIEGAWRLEEDAVVFTDILADGIALEQSPARLTTMNTGVLRIATDRAQYKFRIRRD